MAISKLAVAAVALAGVAACARAQIFEAVMARAMCSVAEVEGAAMGTGGLFVPVSTMTGSSAVDSPSALLTSNMQGKACPDISTTPSMIGGVVRVDLSSGDVNELYAEAGPRSVELFPDATGARIAWPRVSGSFYTRNDGNLDFMPTSVESGVFSGSDFMRLFSDVHIDLTTFEPAAGSWMGMSGQYFVLAGHEIVTDSDHNRVPVRGQLLILDAETGAMTQVYLASNSTVSAVSADPHSVDGFNAAITVCSDSSTISFAGRDVPLTGAKCTLLVVLGVSRDMSSVRYMDTIPVRDTDMVSWFGEPDRDTNEQRMELNAVVTSDVFALFGQSTVVAFNTTDGSMLYSTQATAMADGSTTNSVRIRDVSVPRNGHMAYVALDMNGPQTQFEFNGGSDRYFQARLTGDQRMAVLAKLDLASGRMTAAQVLNGRGGLSIRTVTALNAPGASDTLVYLGLQTDWAYSDDSNKILGYVDTTTWPPLVAVDWNDRGSAHMLLRDTGNMGTWDAESASFEYDADGSSGPSYSRSCLTKEQAQEACELSRGAFAFTCTSTVLPDSGCAPGSLGILPNTCIDTCSA